MLSRSSGKLGTLVDKNLKPKSALSLGYREFSQRTPVPKRTHGKLVHALDKARFTFSTLQWVVNQSLQNRMETHLITFCPE
jgi:hypothetical protein